MRKFLIHFAADESGATAIEYGLIAALIAVVIMGSVALIGTNLNTVFGAVAKCIADPTAENCKAP